MSWVCHQSRDIAFLASNYLRIEALDIAAMQISTWPREHVMGTVMVKCPNTGRNIPTGIVADRVSFNSTPVFFARVHCPICRTEHEWFAKEAWVCDSEPFAAPQVAA